MVSATALGAVGRGFESLYSDLFLQKACKLPPNSLPFNFKIVSKGSMNKTLFVLLNGICDVPLRDLQSLTPLEKAKTPCLDALAAQSIPYSFEPCNYGGSERALLSLMGVEAETVQLTQASLEALAKGYLLKADEYAYALRFVTLGNRHIINVCNSLLSDQEGEILCRDLSEAYKDKGFYFLHLRGPRAVLVSKKDLFAEAFQHDFFNPIKVMEKEWFTSFDAPLTAEAQRWLEDVHGDLNCHDINALKEDLDEDLVNAFLFYNGGKSTQEELFSPMIEGKTTYFFSDSHSSQGIAKHLGIPFHFTGDERKRFSHCVQVMQQLPQLLKQREIVFMEWNYLWRSTYNGDLLEKIKTIEWFDKNIISQLIPLCKECRSDLVFLPLRPCSIEDGDLLPGTVPALHYSPESIQSHSMKYTEKEFEDCPRYPLSELVNVLNKESMVEV